MKTVFITTIAIALLAIGGYFLYQNYQINAPVSVSTPEEVVQAQDITVGTGAQASPGSIVSVLYTGRLSDGTVFDSSEARGNEPLTFQLGEPGIIVGFQIGVNGMREGGERTMLIPPSFGYGGQELKDPATGTVVIPASSTLIFSVRLLKAEPAPAEPPTTE